MLVISTHEEEEEFHAPGQTREIVAWYRHEDELVAVTSNALISFSAATANDAIGGRAIMNERITLAVTRFRLLDAGSDDSPRIEGLSAVIDTREQVDLLIAIADRGPLAAAGFLKGLGMTTTGVSLLAGNAYDEISNLCECEAGELARTQWDLAFDWPPMSDLVEQLTKHG